MLRLLTMWVEPGQMEAEGRRIEWLAGQAMSELSGCPHQALEVNCG
jgi:hypothetical protein